MTERRAQVCLVLLALAVLPSTPSGWNTLRPTSIATR